MTLILDRADFLHLTRLCQLPSGHWQTECACGWTSNPAVLPEHLERVCPQRLREIPIELRPTPESIAAAKAATDRDRREAERLTGCRILEDGRVILPRHPEGRL